jgi:LDH2 family malate/lactate/ureidoglycolate dehydrogenase
MPIVHAEPLRPLVVAIFEKLGAPPDRAATMTRHMVGANLAGHDSHGVILLPTYAERIRKGDVVPDAPIELLDETPTTARVDGHWGFGQVVSEYAMELAIAKAKAQNVAALTVVQQAHVGRVADYPLMAARAGMIGWMYCDSGRTAKQVTPFGGREARLGTNPLSIALPSDLEAPVFLDMATSAVAGGKIAVARNRGQQLPLGWIVDKDGNPATDPAELTRGGSQLPLGGTEGHKGYGLGFMVEVFAGILTGLGFGVNPSGRHNDGSLMIVLNVAAFRPIADFRREVGEFARYVKATPTAPGVKEIYYPGELEWRTEQARRRDGIPIEDETWSAVVSTADSLGLRDLLPSFRYSWTRDELHER